MNDNMEIKWYLNRLNDEKCSLKGTVGLRPFYYLPYEELIDALNSKGQNSVYISCFSKEPDMLSQWRAYAEDGKGVSIGFNLDKLKKADNLLIREVIYTDNVVCDDTESDVECVADTIDLVIREHGITVREEQTEAFLHELIPELVKYKNPAFVEEKEIRLIYCDDMKFEEIIDRYGGFQEKFKSVKLEHDFRTVGSDSITEFVKLDFCVSDIEEICIGPKCLLSKYDIKNIVKNLLDIEINIIESRSSYR